MNSENTARWQNPYKELILEDSNLIFASNNQSITDGELNSLRERLSEHRLFHLEIGSGNGTHLIAQALANPEIHYIGIEKRFKRVYKTLQKAEIAGCKNINMLQTNLDDALVSFSPATIAHLYILFPDPWPKARWHKNRLTHESRLRKYWQLLTYDGVITFRTDNEQLFFDTLATLEKLSNIYIFSYQIDHHNDGVVDFDTDFERMFKEKGYKIFSMRVKKISPQ